jgi:hypothetical protein
VGLLMPFFAGLYAGQVNPLATLPAAAAVVLVGAGRTVGGGLLGLSLTLKPLALGLAALLLWEGRWRALFGAVITALVLLSLPAAVFGPRALNFVGAGLSAGTTSYPPAQSLPGLAARWLTAHPYGFSLADHPAAARWAGLCLSALVLAVTAAACWPPGRSGSSFQARAGLVCAAAMLANPGTWYHHATMLGIPLAVLLGRSAGRPGGGGPSL